MDEEDEEDELGARLELTKSYGYITPLGSWPATRLLGSILNLSSLETDRGDTTTSHKRLRNKMKTKNCTEVTQPPRTKTGLRPEVKNEKRTEVTPPPRTEDLKK